MHVAHRVQQPAHLLLAGPDDTRIRVAGGGDAERACQIQVFFPVDVPDVNAFGVVPDNRPRAVSINKSDVPRLKVTKLLQDVSGVRHKFTIYG